MKKGQKVRLNDNTIATIADSTFFVLNGKSTSVMKCAGQENGRADGCWLKNFFQSKKRLRLLWKTARRHWSPRYI